MTIQKRRRIGILLALVLTLVLLVGCECGAPAATPSPGTKPASGTPTVSTPPASTTPAPESSPVSTLPSPTMVLYESTEHGFSIRYPEGWTEFTHGGVASFYLQYQEPEGDFAIGLSVDYKAEPIALADVVAEGKDYMEAMLQYELLSEGDVTIGEGIPGYEMIGQGDEGAGKVKKHRYVIVVREKQAFWVGVSGDPEQFDEQRQLVDAIIDSFRLLATYTYEPPATSPGGTYTSDEYGFSITYPDGWSDVTTGEYSEILYLRADAGIPELMVRTWTGGGSAAEAALTLQQVYQENFPDYELLSEGELTLDDGTPAYVFVFNATMQGYFLTAKCVTVMRGEEVFSMMGFGSPSTFTQDELVLDEIIGSFHFE